MPDRQVHHRTSGGSGAFLGLRPWDGPRSAARRTRRRSLGLEALERRVLLSAISFDADAPGGNGRDNGMPDEFLIVRNDAALEFYVDGSLSQTVPIASVDSVVVNGSGDNDTLTLDLSGGPIDLPGGITFHGEGQTGDPGDALVVTGGSAAAVTHTLGVGGSGSIVIDGAVVSYTGLEPVVDLVVAGTLTINGTNSDNAINYVQGSDASRGLVSVDGFETIEFSNKTALVLNGLGGSDTFNLNNPTTPTTLTGITVIGGDPTASDTLVVNGTAGADSIDFAPTTDDDATITGAGPVPIVAGTVEHVIVDGQGGGDALTITTPAGADTVSYAPGPAVDSGAVSVGSLLPMSFENLGAGTVTLADAGVVRDDTLMYEGTGADDAFVLAATTGDITLNSQLVVSTPGVDAVTLEGRDGDDSYAVSTPQPYTLIVLSGGGPSGSDSALVLETANSVDVLLDNGATIVSSGLGTVALPGIELVTLMAGDQDVTIAGSPAPETYVVTPIGADDAMVEIEGAAPSVRTVTTGLLTVDDGTSGDGDTLVVNLSSQGETVSVTGTSVAVTAGASLKTVSYSPTNVEALRVNGDGGQDTFDVTPSAAVPIVIYGGDPIGLIQGSGDTLNLITGGSPFVFYPGPEPDAGTFEVGGDEPISFDEIELLQINGVDYILPDRFEPNDSIAEATVLGSEHKITLRGLTLHDNGGGAVDEDYFQITAQDTGKIIINAFFVDEDGDINIEVLDESGDFIAGSASVTDNEQLVIPVVSQQRYFLRAFPFGAEGEPNVYDLEIENFSAPIPNALDLDPDDDTGMSDMDDVTTEDEARVVIEADLTEFANEGIAILTAANAVAGNVAGAAVEVFVDGVSVGFAEPIPATNDDLFEFTFAPADLAEGVNMVKAAVRIFDGQTPNADGRTQLSVPLVLTLDTVAPPVPSTPDMVPSSDSGPSDSDDVTSIMAPAFQGSGEANSKVRVYADGAQVGPAARVPAFGARGGSIQYTFTETIEELVRTGVLEILE